MNEWAGPLSPPALLTWREPRGKSAHAVVWIRSDTGTEGRDRRQEKSMIIVGLVLLVLGLLLGVPLLWTLGVIVLIVGLVLMLLGSTGRAVGGRRHYW